MAKLTAVRITFFQHSLLCIRKSSLLSPVLVSSSFTSHFNCITKSKDKGIQALRRAQILFSVYCYIFYFLEKVCGLWLPQKIFYSLENGDKSGIFCVLCRKTFSTCRVPFYRKKKNNNLKTRDEQTDTFVSLLQWLSWKRETCFQNCIFNFYDVCY